MLEEVKEIWFVTRGDVQFLVLKGKQATAFGIEFISEDEEWTNFKLVPLPLSFHVVDAVKGTRISIPRSIPAVVLGFMKFSKDLRRLQFSVLRYWLKTATYENDRPLLGDQTLVLEIDGVMQFEIT